MDVPVAVESDIKAIPPLTSFVLQPKTFHHHHSTNLSHPEPVIVGFYSIVGLPHDGVLDQPVSGTHSAVYSRTVDVFGEV
jgi:hypothetical protein